jgi:4-diphosphocytidyl-2-C-methyl-D-erythritol kinase
MKPGKGADVQSLEARIRAPAKLNLSLFLGSRREDGLHEIRSIFQPLSLADEISVQPAPQDEVVCPGIDEPELASQALAAIRERGWTGGPVRIEIQKKIPVAAGLGGGSADAAAVLGLAEGEVEGLDEIATELGADVPSQLEPGPALVSGAGEHIERLEPTRELSVVLLPSAPGLATSEVFAEADRLGLARDQAALDGAEARLRAAASDGFDPLQYPELLVNDLQPAAISLRPEIEDALKTLRDGGADAALLTGSGPTVFGLFADHRRAEGVASELANRDPQPIATVFESANASREGAPA